MSIFKCKMCGGTIEFEPGASVGVCEYCGTKQTLPRLDDERRANLHDRANHFRRSNEFDKAAAIYEQIITEDPGDAEAYWALVLCRYGIEYVEDPETHKRVPTVNRAQFTSIFDDDDYKSALKCAEPEQQILYEEEAKVINEIQKGILAISQKEEPFDVFICYKETDKDGRRTPDSVLATDLYHQLKQEGFKVFFSRITLEDKLGTAYEPYIFAALNSAKVMVVLGTKPEYFDAVWVKNEWSRYLSLIKQSKGKKMLIPAYRDMDPYDLPEEFSHLQAQDMSKLGFMQDLIRGIKKIVKADLPKIVVEEVKTTAGKVNVAPLLERAFMFLEDGNWEEADIYCEKVLDQEPKNARAYLGKLMAELCVRREEDLVNCEAPFDGSANYQKAVRFGDEKLVDALSDYIEQINQRNELARCRFVYNDAISEMNRATNEEMYLAAAEKFRSISGFEDADEFIKMCCEKAEDCRCETIYQDAQAAKIATYFSDAIRIFQSISGYKDADEQVLDCQREIEERKAAAEAEQKKQAKIKKIKAITVAAVFATAALVVGIAMLVTKVFVPNANYNNAMKLYEAGNYEEAISAFTALDGYKDSEEQILNCRYDAAKKDFDDGKYEEAKKAFANLSGYKDSDDMVLKCNDAINEPKYKAAVKLFEEGKFEEAVKAFKSFSGYRSEATATYIKRCEDAIMGQQYHKALELSEEGKFAEALEIFLALGESYTDSASQIKKCRYGVADQAAQKGDVIPAYEGFAELGEYKDSADRAKSLKNKYKSAIYQYVKNHMSASDMTTYRYLTFLVEENYMGCKDLYDNLYQWKAELVYYNTTQGNTTTISSSISKKPTYVHFGVRITGGAPDSSATATFTHRVTLPGSSSSTSKWDWENCKSGDLLAAAWSSGWSCSKDGTAKLEIINKATGKVIASYNMTIKW
ncbi:MAG: TIR domain-containing protein [Clostridia bacterium]|nr:TIR domain-containing protein [Clostridia bacterium]